MNYYKLACAALLLALSLFFGYWSAPGLIINTLVQMVMFTIGGILLAEFIPKKKVVNNAKS